MVVTKRKCVILVTGASGFLGQHVVSALSKYADHVTEIRVFDKIRYENKMVHPIKKDVRHFEGDLLDRTILTQACNDVDGVIHLAGYIDINVRPNIEKSLLINVEGTRTLLEISKAAGVKRFIYCSSTAVAIGLKNVLHGTEDSVPVPPPKFLSSAYGTSKYEAEKLVLEANCEAFKTIALRPGFLYGEHNSIIDRRIKSGWFRSKYVPELRDDTAHEWVYVGNVACAFVRAEISLYESYKIGMAGEAYFICDDTPVISSTVHYSVHEICFEDAGLKPLLPLPVFRLLISCIQFCLYCFCCIQIYVFQTKAVIDIIKLIPFRKQKFRATSQKAKRLLGYEPMYSFKEAKERTTAYIHSLL